MWTSALGVLLLSVLAVANLPGEEFIGVGYNLLTGNPDGGDTTRGGVDPGLLYTRKILKISLGDHPPEVVEEIRHSCAHTEGNHVFYGAKSYQDKLALSVKSDGGVFAAIVKFAFSLSAQYKYMRVETNQLRQVFLDDQRICNLGRVRYADELAATHGFSVSTNFAEAVCQLPKVYNESKYMAFLDHWGTHVTMEVELGTKEIKRYKTSLIEFFEHVLTQGGSDISLGGSYMGYSTSLVVNFNEYKTNGNHQVMFGTITNTLESGNAKFPEPIGIKVFSIDMALNVKYWQDVEGHQCENDLDIVARQQNVIKALTNYATYKMAEAPTDPPLQIPVTWPQGTYGLMKAKSGCPGGRAKWYEGWRYEDLEDSSNNDHVSDNIHLSGYFGGNMRFEFCMKKDVKASNLDMMWPAGDYCLLKYGNCPAEFQEGWLFWDDEDHNNENNHGGTLPDGVYNHNTKTFYCCRDDGVHNHEIILPTDKPFYLLRYNSECQYVNGMHLIPEDVRRDTEDDNNADARGGAHPYVDGSGIHYCYYTPSYNTPIVG